MHFSTAILALAASASAVVIPRANGGFWEVSVEQLDSNNAFYTNAILRTEAYPEGLRSHCVINPNETPVFNRCDRAAFTADWDGKTLKLSQTVEKPKPQTLFGEAEFTLTPDEYTATTRAEGTVEVQKAIA